MSYSDKLMEILDELNDYAQDYDKYEYGLPLHTTEKVEWQKKIINIYIKDMLQESKSYEFQEDYFKL